MRKLFTLTILFVFATASTNAQLNYTVTYPTMTYTALTGTVTHPTLTMAYPPTLATNEGVANTDEGAANNILLPFPFTYGCVTYNVCHISTNGFIALGAAIDTFAVYYTNNLSFGPSDSVINSSRFTRPLIAPLWDDIDLQASTNLTIQTTGTAPNRIFTVEWKNAKWFWQATSAAINFQVKLYEVDNSILFHYKPATGNLVSASASVGLTDCSFGSGSFLSLSDLTNTATVSSSYSYDSIKTKPAANFAIKFTPAQCSQLKSSSPCHSYPVITGEVFYDNNSNGIKDPTEPNATNIKVKLVSGRYAFTDNKGHFIMYADSLGVNNLTINNPNFYVALPQTINYTFNSFDTVVTSSFALQPIVSVDSMELTVTPINFRARPGFSYPYIISYKNIGTNTISPTLDFSFNNTKLTYDSSNNTSVTSAVNNLSLSISNIVPGQTGNFVAYFRVKPTVAIGDSVIVYATLTKAVNAKVVSWVWGSYDPNDKEATPVLTPTQVAISKDINYTIRFQNTGSDTAFTVTISDSLSSDLQANTLELVGSSHKCKTTINGNIVLFEFYNIKLADSNINEIASHGFVSFKIKPRQTLINGDKVTNKAFIYFDFNSPVVTNEAVTQINTSGIITPLALQSFTGKLNSNKTVTLNWQASETNMNKYIVEKSVYDNKYNTLGSVQAINKSNAVYDFKDENPNKGANYYRLQMIENNGKISYSNIVVILLENNSSITVFPNPAKDAVNINSKGVKHLTITDCFGRIIEQLNNITEHKTINTKQWSNGIYIFSFDNGEKVKVVKE